MAGGVCTVATFTYSVQARWIWGPTGFLADMGVIDIAGSGAVHLMGGTAAFVGAWMLGPRLGRYDKDDPPPAGNPLNVLLGLFNLWWGWFAFNAGSSYGMSGGKWKFAARAASTTVIASIGGGMVGMFYTFIKGYRGSRVPFEIMDTVNGVLGALVGITAGCSIFHTPEAFLTGIIGAGVVIASARISDKLKVDDPVSATAVHGFGGIWGMLAVGFFADDDGGILGLTKGNLGLIRGGSAYLLGVQLLAVVCIIAWSFITTFIFLWVINRLIPLRITEEEERLGLDVCEHGIVGENDSSSSPNSTIPSISHLIGSDRRPGWRDGGKVSAGPVRSPRPLRGWATTWSSSYPSRNRKLSGESRASKKEEQVGRGWSPQETVAEYTTPATMEEKVGKSTNNDKDGNGLRQEGTKILEWTRTQLEMTGEDMVIVKTV